MATQGSWSVRLAPSRLLSALPVRRSGKGGGNSTFLGTLARRMSSSNVARTKAQGSQESAHSAQILSLTASVKTCVAFVSLKRWKRSRQERGSLAFLSMAIRRYESLNQSAEESLECSAEQNEARLREANVLLDAMERTFRTLRIVEANRSYRNDFTPSYRGLFYGARVRWLFRFDVLDAAQNRIGAIWVNGARYAFPDDVIQAGIELAEKWAQLSQCICNVPKWNSATTEMVVGMIMVLDQHWVRFEEGYIKRLILIEAHAKRILVNAVALGEELISRPDPVTRRNLVRAINVLNSVGNVEGKGRADLSVEILNFIEHHEVCAELHCLVDDIRKSFDDVCAYLHSIAFRLDMVDPHVPNNGDLVRLLRRWEESWEIGKKYLLNDGLRIGVVSLVRHVKTVCLDGMDTFREKLHTLDVDALWAVATIVVLHFLSSPRSDLLCREFLPECWKDDDSLEALAVFYTELPGDYFHHLYLCAIGSSEPDKRVAAFWMELNVVATKLQRRHPNDWNLFVMVFMRCFSVESTEKPQVLAVNSAF